MDKKYKLIETLDDFMIAHPELGPWNVISTIKNGSINVKFLNGSSHRKIKAIHEQ